MFEFNSQDYQNFAYGIVPKKILARKKQHVFTLWDEELILFWNYGEVRCFKNACAHYGLPLSHGKIVNDQVHCGFHGWQYSLSDGSLAKAPYSKKTPKCSLKRYKAFVKGGIVFVYPGEDKYFELRKILSILNHVEVFKCPAINTAIFNTAACIAHTYKVRLCECSTYGSEA